MDDLSRQGIEHFNGGRFDQALRCFRAAIAAGADGPETRCLLAHALDGAGSPQKAATEFAAALKVFPRHLPAYAGLANLLLRRGALPGAAQALGRSLRLKPVGRDGRRKLIETLRLCADAWRAAGEPRAAEKALNRAFALDPKNPESRRRIVETLRLREQEYLYERNRRLEALRQRGANTGDFDIMEKSLRQALALAPCDPESRRLLLGVLRRRALAYLAAGKLEFAQKAARKALEFAPGDKESKCLLLEVLHARAAPAPDTLALAEKTLRKALALAPRDAETRRRLLDVLRRRAQARFAAGEFSAAERILRRALLFEPGDQETRERLVEALNLRARKLQSAGRRAQAAALSRRILRLQPADARARMSRGDVLYISGRTREGRALLAQAVRRDGGSLTPSERFKTLMKLGRHREAVAAAESILDGSPTLADTRAFWDPWEWDERRPRSARRDELEKLEVSLQGETATPWLHYYRADLTGPGGLEHFERLADYPPQRYGWMYFKAAMTALLAGCFKKAASWFTLALKHEPVDWRARCFLAETCLCLQRPELAYAEMERALSAAPPAEAGQVLAWRGAFDLWLGRYEEALVRLEEACRLDAQCAFCWKAGALLKLGRAGEALKLLDLTLKRYPLDFEAYVWRGEAKRRLGRHREALKDLERVPATIELWALFNRALAKKSLGDLPGMQADFDKIPAHIRDHIRRKIGDDAPEKILEAGLELARGFRRDEYRQAIWIA